MNSLVKFKNVGFVYDEWVSRVNDILHKKVGQAILYRNHYGCKGHVLIRRADVWLPWSYIGLEEYALVEVGGSDMIETQANWEKIKALGGTSTIWKTCSQIIDHIQNGYIV